MEIILTGRNFTAQEAEQWGLVSKVFPVDKLLDESIRLGQEIAGFSQPVIQAAKESVNNGLVFFIHVNDILINKFIYIYV